MKKRRIRLLIAIAAAVCIAFALLLLCLSGSECCDNGGAVLMVKNPTISVESLAGQRIGVLTGTIFDRTAEQIIDSPKVNYFETNADMCTGLKAGKIAAFITDEPLARYMFNSYPDFNILTKIAVDDYGYIFNKDTVQGHTLCREMNEFLANLKADGTLTQLDAVWFGTDETLKTVDYSHMDEGENGKLIFVTTSSTGAPFSYIKDGRLVGYDVDIALRFCAEYGYAVELTDSNFTGMIAAVKSGKADFAASCVTITEDRKESVLFSDPNYTGGIVIVYNPVSEIAAESGELKLFLLKQLESFRRTFIEEKRWQLFLLGLGNTLLITVLSVLLGTAFGFLLYSVCAGTGGRFTRAAQFLGKMIHGMPVVVLLMILFYIVFPNGSLSGTFVSVIGFTLIFCFSVYRMVQNSTDTVPATQIEAAYALGFGKSKTFRKVIWPQASRHFLPAYRAETVTLIKATAMVGYVAVQDLTKVSDVIRSRTYDAFFSLIVTALLYYLLEILLTAAVDAMLKKTDTKRRSKEQILKGTEGVKS